MKKITLFFAAIAIAVSVSAQDFVIGTYSSSTGFTEQALENADPADLSFAIKVNSTPANAILITMLDGAADRVLAVSGVRIGDGTPNYFLNSDIRLTKGAGDYVYYLENFDLGETLKEGAAIPETGHLHSNVLVAGEDFWWDENVAAGWDPGAHYLYLGNYKVGGGDPGTGIDAVIAEKGEPVAVEYFTLQGAKTTAPKGVVIKKSIFADGSTYVEKEAK